jgi:aspartate racemase
MPAIYGVKSGDSANAKPKIIEAAQRLIQHGADLAIAGCTEVPIILKPKDIPIPLLDPVHVLAECCLRLYFEKK